MRPPFTYYGGKQGMARRIVHLLPEHRVYMEPFFGSGAVLFAKRPAVHEIVNDIDRSVVTFFRVLRERPAELEWVCGLSPCARDEFNLAELDDDIDDLERARRFWVRVNQSFAKTAGRQTGWSITTARTQAVPASILSRLGRFAACVERLANVAIESCDAVDLIDRLATKDTALYVDPPYLASTRRSRDRQRPADYLHDMGMPEDHRRLADVLHSTPATVILSGYPSELYDELYGDWWYTDLAVTVHSSNASSAPDSGLAGRGARIERLWANRDLSEGILDLYPAAEHG